MQTGLSVPEGYGIDLETAVDVALSGGCDFLEVLLDGRLRPASVTADRPPALVETDLDIVTHFPFTVPLWSPIERYQVGLERTHDACLDAAVALGADAAVVHPSNAAMGDAFDTDDVIPGVLDAISDLHAAGADRDIDVHIENIQTGPFTLDGLSRVITETPAAVVIDTGHARVSGHDHDDLLAFVDTHHDDIAHLHLNDTRGASDDHLPLGAGTVDFHSVLDAFDPDWPGRACVETIAADPASLERSLTHLETILESTTHR